ncbi:MAG: hypothetical protein EAX89_12150 [Candidatus Lokiarchaeota archaeon]|nr:hypothetical protein [Candidatus Lokiarchaeota archaeon]
MIDEEDDEEILEKGISLKNVLKNLLLVALIIIGALFIYLGGQDSTTNFFIGFTLICFGSTLIQIQKQPAEPIRQTLTIIKCSLCNITSVRHYKQGDYVFKMTESCQKCTEPMKIAQIYSVKLKKPTKEMTEKEKAKKEKTKPKKDKTTNKT